MSFGPQAFDGVGQGGFYRLEADGEQGDQEHAGAGYGEDPPCQAGAIAVVLQPLMHAQPGHWYGDKEGK